jgi:hypothetical protein
MLALSPRPRRQRQDAHRGAADQGAHRGHKGAGQERGLPRADRSAGPSGGVGGGDRGLGGGALALARAPPRPRASRRLAHCQPAPHPPTPRPAAPAQQARYLASQGLVAQPFCGDMAIGGWGAPQWRAQLEACEVLALTPDVLRHVVSHAYLSVGAAWLPAACCQLRPPLEGCHRRRRVAAAGGGRCGLLLAAGGRGLLCEAGVAGEARRAAGGGSAWVCWPHMPRHLPTVPPVAASLWGRPAAPGLWAQRVGRCCDQRLDCSRLQHRPSGLGLGPRPSRSLRMASLEGCAARITHFQPLRHPHQRPHACHAQPVRGAGDADSALSCRLHAGPRPELLALARACTRGTRFCLRPALPA